MAEESDLEKSEPASPARLEKAREEGQVARSRELVTFVMLATGMGALWAMGAMMGEHFSSALRNGLQFERASAFDPSHMMVQAGTAVLHALQALTPLLAMMLVAALVAPMMLGGWLFSTKSLAPSFSKMNPIAGIGRMFSTESLAELVKTIVKSLLVGGVAWWVISAEVGDIMALMSEPVHAALPHTLKLVALTCALIIGSLLLVALIDVPYQLWSHHRKLRMSREDLRQEQKENDGDPQVKAQIRRQQQMAKRRMMAEVPKADIIVTNPTHFAVALKYHDKEMRAPRVVAKGADLVALRIRAMAEEHKIPILEAAPLTRALYRHTKLGDEVPAALYAAVAEVLAWAYQLTHQLSQGGTAPRAPQNLPVPESLDSLGSLGRAA